MQSGLVIVSGDSSTNIAIKIESEKGMTPEDARRILSEAPEIEAQRLSLVAPWPKPAKE